MSEVYHYGVLGMKWGVRKDRPNKPTRSEKNKRSALEYDYRLAKNYERTARRSIDTRRNAIYKAKTKALLDDKRKELEDYVSHLNDKYGQENIKQLKKERVRAGKKAIDRLNAEYAMGLDLRQFTLAVLSGLPGIMADATMKEIRMNKMLKPYKNTDLEKNAEEDWRKRHNK